MRSLVYSLALVLATSLVQAQSNSPVLVMTLDDAIGPATADYFVKGLNEARERNAALVVLQLDTPGGLDTAMRDIIRAMIASPVPVAIYVSPSGARAASAGTYMLYAAHVAAMAPGTNLGAATPVQIGGLPDVSPGGDKPAPPKADQDAEDQAGDEKPSAATPESGDAMTKKMVNDAVAYIRSLAEMRGRNADWAETAVRQAASLSAEQAVEQNVVDLLADDVDDLLDKVNGMVVKVNNADVAINTDGAPVETIEQDWRNRLLAVITNPNVAYILMLLGIYGLFFELANPGFVVPGVIGGICLLLALYAMQVLPVNFAGVALILLGIGFMVAEIFVPSFGALGIGGVVAFIIGSIILFDVEGTGNIAVSKSLIGTVSFITAAFFLIIIRMAIKAHMNPIVSGKEEMIGAQGEVLDGFDKKGFIHVHGENWQAESAIPVHHGDRVRVTAVNGLILHIEPLEEKES